MSKKLYRKVFISLTGRKTEESSLCCFKISDPGGEQYDNRLGSKNPSKGIVPTEVGVGTFNFYLVFLISNLILEIVFKLYYLILRLCCVNTKSSKFRRKLRTVFFNLTSLVGSFYVFHWCVVSRTLNRIQTSNSGHCCYFWMSWKILFTLSHLRNKYSDKKYFANVTF